ncbi:MAG TPA: type 4a pilus biogenesis protein PilO [Lacunisphaera sp.]|jgi:Tfp pilus assembly protein PilO|nr:type 4a pilus biogenesis protein PilO [Lacunisphaera sp.]
MKNFFSQVQDFSRRNPVLVISLAVIVVMGSLSYYLWARQRELTAEHDEVKRSGEDMLQSLTSHARIMAEINSVTQALAFIDKNLVNEGDLAENLGYFYQIENNAHIRFTGLNQLSSQPGPADAPYKTVPFSLRATGTYRQMLRLLHELETGPRLLRVKTFSVTGSDTAEDVVTMELNVELLAKP